MYEKHAINRCDLSAAVQCVYLPSGRVTSWHIQEYVGEKCRTKCKTRAKEIAAVIDFIVVYLQEA